VHDGALVASVESGGPAADAALRGGKDKITFEGQVGIPVGGDVIVGLDGHRITGSAELTNLVAQHEPGQKVTLQVVRDNARRTLTVTLGTRPDKPATGN